MQQHTSAMKSNYYEQCLLVSNSVSGFVYYCFFRIQFRDISFHDTPNSGVCPGLLLLA